jgi:hypothetical protein
VTRKARHQGVWRCATCDRPPEEHSGQRVPPVKDLQDRTREMLVWLSDHGGGEPGPFPQCNGFCPQCMARALLSDLEKEWKEQRDDTSDS